MFKEFQALLAELVPHARMIATVAYYTGLRKGEILDLTRDRVNLERCYLELRAGDTKGKKPRRVYFNEEVKRVLLEALKVRAMTHNYVFTYEGRPLKSLRRSFESGCRRAGINDLLFHDLRHTFKTNLRKAGVDRLVIKAIIWGLRRPTDMLEWYDTVDDSDLKEAVEKLDKYLLAQKNAPIVAPKNLPT